MHREQIMNRAAGGKIFLRRWFLVLLESDLKVVRQFLFGSGALLFDVQQLSVVVQHDH